MLLRHLLSQPGYIHRAVLCLQTAPKAVAALKAALERDGVALADDEGAGFFRMCQYGPVYSFSNRENELLLRVKL